VVVQDSRRFCRMYVICERPRSENVCFLGIHCVEFLIEWNKITNCRASDTHIPVNTKVIFNSRAIMLYDTSAISNYNIVGSKRRGDSLYLLNSELLSVLNSESRFHHE
jgi:hypothetical protein